MRIAYLPIVVVAFYFVETFAFAQAAGQKNADQCTICHQQDRFKTTNKKLYDYFRYWKGSVHDEAKVLCSDCHGGNSKTASKEKAHKEMLAPSNKNSLVFFTQIPKTCGKCHDKIYNNFIKSDHYQALMKKDEAPNCITCHGSLNTEVYYSSIVDKTCSGCHKENNHASVIPTAKKILSRINGAKRYKRWANLYYQANNQEVAMKKANELYDHIAQSWHRFDFSKLDDQSKDLLFEVRALYNNIKRQELKKK